MRLSRTMSSFSCWATALDRAFQFLEQGRQLTFLELLQLLFGIRALLLESLHLFFQFCGLGLAGIFFHQGCLLLEILHLFGQVLAPLTKGLAQFIGFTLNGSLDPLSLRKTWRPRPYHPRRRL